jgi:predicted transcriptional regulator
VNLDELAAISGALERAQAAGEMIHASRADVSVMAAIRRDAIRELTRTMPSHADVARALGVTPVRVSEILGRDVRKRAERAARAAARARMTPEEVT